MSSFSFEEYNTLPKLQPAHDRLRTQLKSANETLDSFLNDPAITKLFLQGDHANAFGICIMHRHYDLKNGERMVMSQDPNNPLISITRPCPELPVDPRVFADRWMLNGRDFEYVVCDPGNPISAPPLSFFEDFRKICCRFEVDILGICRADLDPVPQEGQVYLEEADGVPEDRRQRTSLVLRDDIPASSNPRPSAWVPIPQVVSLNQPANDTATNLSALKCVHTCTSHVVPPNPQGSTVAVEIESKVALDSIQDSTLAARARSVNHI